MMPYLTTEFGNAASKNHVFGRKASDAVNLARDIIATALRAHPRDICFTSGATEAINLAIKGVFHASGEVNQHYITAVTEHPAVLDSFRRIEAQGAQITRIGVDSLGMVNPDEIARAMTTRTKMVCVMAANNEIGVIQPLKEIGELCRKRNVFFMTDATQAFGRIPLDAEALHIDLLACSAHKVYGPKGIGALYCRQSKPAVSLQPMIDGGGHERGLRSGTLNVPAIVGFAKAVEICASEREEEQGRLLKLRDSLFGTIRESLPDVKLNGHSRMRLAGNLNLCIPGIDSESLVAALGDKVALSTGSACTTALVEPSHVLKALGIPSAEMRSSFRIGLGRSTTMEEAAFAAKVIADEAVRQRKARQER